MNITVTETPNFIIRHSERSEAILPLEENLYVRFLRQLIISFEIPEWNVSSERR